MKLLPKRPAFKIETPRGSRLCACGRTISATKSECLECSKKPTPKPEVAA